MATEVRNVDQPGSISIYTLDARSAVIAAYAHSIGDNNTWQYAERYTNRVICINNRLGVRYILGTFWAKE